MDTVPAPARPGAAPAPARLQPGSRLRDRYEIVASVGVGGMGEVFRARDLRLDRDVAIKVINPRSFQSVDLHDRFLRETRTVAALSHPNVMTLHDVADDDGLMFAVMEFVEGKTLRTVIANGLAWPHAVALARGIAEGLGAAHARNLMHRDIKPENVIVSDDGHPVILDFGLARPEAPGADQDLTDVPGAAPGTIPYMSPEQAEGSELTCATDIFSFGTVLYEMLTGVNPFHGPSAFETRRRIAEAHVSAPAGDGSAWPAPLESLVQHMLQRSATARPPAREVAARLHGMLHEQGAAAPAPAGAPVAVEPAPTSAAPGFVLPETRYARCGDLHIAYQLFGDGPANLVIAPGFISNVDNAWANAELTSWLRSLSRSARIAMFDKRGTGLSDRVESLPSMDERMEDVCAVMDAAGFESAAILGISEGGSLASLFAATYPHRCTGLVLHGSFAKFESWFATEEDLEQLLEYIRTAWGSGASLPMFAPTVAQDPAYQEWWGKFERLGANPGAAIALMRMNSQIDISSILPVIQAPTLVIRRDDDVLIDPEAGDYLAEQIPRARLVRSPGADHIPWVGEAVEAEVAAVDELLREATAIDIAEQVLATVLAVRADDPAREESIRTHVRRFRGTDLHATGSALVTTFDGPARAVHCARAMIQATPDVAIGVHTAEVSLRRSRVDGPGVHVAERIAGRAAPGDVLVSRTVTDLVAGSGFEFTHVGEHDATDAPGDRRLYRVEDDRT
jgi:serine/threonine protein kinase